MWRAGGKKLSKYHRYSGAPSYILSEKRVNPHKNTEETPDNINGNAKLSGNFKDINVKIIALSKMLRPTTVYPIFFRFKY